MARNGRVDASAAVAPRWAAVALALASAVAVLAEASGIGVVENRSVEAVFAERGSLDLRLEVRETRIAPALLDRPALGTPAAPVELAEAPLPAGTAATRGHWTYEALVMERAPGSVPRGAFDVTLHVDGRFAGRVRVLQNLSNPLVEEGARVLFDVGPHRPEAPIFVVAVEKATPPESEFRLRSVNDSLNPLTPRWRGVGGAIEGQTNPTLDVGAGDEARLVAENGDDGYHNLQVMDAEGRVVAGPTDDIAAFGAEASLSWTPEAPGSYSYACAYHADSMTGQIDVT